VNVPFSDIVIASQNAGKLRELRAALSAFGITVLAPSDVQLTTFDVTETGSTFQENATLKAVAFAQASGRWAVGDDSGLCVHALHDEPGIASKRWFPGSDHDRNQALLQRIARQHDRSVPFLCVLVVADPSGVVRFCAAGRVDGTLAREERGDNGFAYDKIFIPDGYDQTLAELGDAIKTTISHRARAFAALVSQLSEQNKK
jgi:XTP/dITP diphosphohydrolase